jgi:predicted patatin/cPLA2 family phospholipase
VTVVELLRRRSQDLEHGRPFQDGFKLGLAVEGGGMRGIVSGAMLVALDDLGLRQVFDSFYGTSSGSINLAYFEAGHRWDALAIYYDHLATQQFADPWRPLKARRPVLDMALLFDQIMDKVLPLDYEAVIKASPPLKVGVSDLDARQGRVMSEFASGDHLRDHLRAGAWIPVLAGDPVVIGGTRYVDGGVFFANPMYVAQSDGCTHVLSLGTRPQGRQTRHPSLAERYGAARMNRWQEGAGDLYLRNLVDYLRQGDAIGFGETTLDDMRLFRLAVPPGGHSVSRLTMDRAALLDGARAGYVAVMDQLGGRALGLPPFRLGD